MKILLPKPIASGSFLAGTTIPAVDEAAGEVEWIVDTAYTVNTLVAYEGGIYECTKDHTSSANNPPNKANSADWLFKEPTNRMRPFDNYLFTKATEKGEFTYQISGSFVDGIALYAIEADRLEITVTQDGVDLIPPIDMELWEQAFGEWEYLFGNLSKASYFTLSGIPMAPSAVITVTVKRNDPDIVAALGFMAVGNWKELLAPKQTNLSGAQYGASVQTKDYGQTIDYPDGTYKDIEGRKAKNINLTCLIDAAQSPFVDKLLTQVSGKAVAMEVSNLPKYSHLATVGKVSGTVINEKWEIARVEIQVKGNV